MSIEQLTSRVRQSFGGCPQCSKRGQVVPDCIFCGGSGRANNKMNIESIKQSIMKKRKIKSSSLDVDTKVKNEFTDVLMHFTGIHGGVLVATPSQLDRKTKNKTAICVRIDCQDTCWSFYNCLVKFALFSEDEKTCRFSSAGRYVIYSCRIIRDADDLPEAIAAAAVDLWKAE
jgi:hypothetical protein